MQESEALLISQGHYEELSFLSQKYKIRLEKLVEAILEDFLEDQVAMNRIFAELKTKSKLPADIQAWLWHYNNEFRIKIESDIAKFESLTAELLQNRYREHPRSNFHEQGLKDLEDKRVGMLGQTAFLSILNELRIPHNYDVPVFFWRQHRLPADFIIPNFGSVEIKTVKKNDRYLVVKRELWEKQMRTNHVPDYVVVLQCCDDDFLICGWLHGKEIGELPHNPVICPYAPCYCTELSKLRPFNELYAKLKKLSSDLGC